MISIVNPVVTVGIFDGVHSGHIFVLQRLKCQAEKLQGESVVVTLWPHPRLVLNKEPEKLRYLNTFDEKIILLEKAEVDHLFVIPFSKEFAQLDSCGFIKNILVNKLGIKHLVVGYNHKFGRNREGDFNNLKKCSESYGFTIEKTQSLQNYGEKISSSVIREKLLTGELDDANDLLGYDYFLQGKVTGGNRIGREIGFPTANIRPHDEHKLIPCDGVYAVNIELNRLFYNGMMNIGYRPTVHSPIPEKTIEVNIFNFDGDVYGKDVTVFFRKRLRNERKFDSIDQLKIQLGRDKEEALRELKG